VSVASPLFLLFELRLSSINDSISSSSALLVPLLSGSTCGTTKFLFAVDFSRRLIIITETIAAITAIIAIIIGKRIPRMPQRSAKTDSIDLS
ncbi:MAG: hypothetical protein M3258_04815, partial [Thermoproteota archaeon]|nr:hypothetical protein [Thermoproteota archaeon]